MGCPRRETDKSPRRSQFTLESRGARGPDRPIDRRRSRVGRRSPPRDRQGAAVSLPFDSRPRGTTFAREAAEEVRIVSVVEEPDRSPYHRLAGADSVVSPRQVLGRSLAGKVTTAVTTDLGDAVEIGEDFDLAELPVHHGSELAGRTLADSGIRERFGVNVVAGTDEGTNRFVELLG